jgi:hypothetical protein
MLACLQVGNKGGTHPDHWACEVSVSRLSWNTQVWKPDRDGWGGRMILLFIVKATSQTIEPHVRYCPTFFNCSCGCRIKCTH